nr:protein phosphatase 1 regulatory subunit 16A isoform X1 [Halyomorpha halys]
MKEMEHVELVSEMCRVEHMSTAERLQLARRRRGVQLKNWAQREREWLRKRPREPKSTKPGIRFSDNVILLEAASRNDIAEVRKLLMRGVSPDSTNEDGLTALHQCCIDDNEEMMKLLLEFGANVNAEDSERWTPLHAAATCGHLHLVKHLIANGADLLAVNADGNMAYDICEDESSLEEIEGEMARSGVTQALIDETRAETENLMLADLANEAARGGDLEILLDDQGATPLHVAAANGYLRVVEFLLDHHVSTDVKDIDDWQPVHAAACWGHLEVLELLVQNGADLNARTKHDETPADICEDPDLRERIVELRTEQESKKLERRRVRRTQSNNSRACSVRRTSVRERGLTAKRDAAQEARFRLVHHQVLPTIDIPDLGAKVADTNMDSADSIVAVNEGDSSGRKEPDGKDSNIIQASESKSSSPVVEVPTEASYTTESNGKINIHVSVTINAGTLAELKKQRAQNRTSPDISSVVSQATISEVDAPQGFNQVKRFSGEASENFIEDGKTRKCCTLF